MSKRFAGRIALVTGGTGALGRAVSLALHDEGARARSHAHLPASRRWCTRRGTRLPLNRYLVEISVPADAWAACVELDGATPVGWDALPAGNVSLDWGTTWAMDRRSLLARVPSVIVPEEFNVLINPAHAHIARVKARKVRKWLYDGRFAPKEAG